jgi:ribose 5-phosphate isomerase B
MTACTAGCSPESPHARADAILARVRIAVSSDERVGVAEPLVAALARRGHEVVAHGALAGGAGAAEGRAGARREQWAWASEAAAWDVAEGRAELGVVCCFTGTGASIAANKVPGVRAALCGDAATAQGARRWNDANVLAISLRSTAEAELEEILDAFLSTRCSEEADDRANVAHLREIERRSCAVAEGGPEDGGHPRGAGD